MWTRAQSRVKGPLVLFVTASLLSLGAGEFVARALGLSKTWSSYIASAEIAAAEVMTADRVGARRLPNRTWFCARGKWFKSNAAGFRDEDRVLAKPEGVTRIAFIGDSVTEGFGLERAERFSDLTDRLLAEPSSTDYECLNFGITGHSTVDQLVTLRDHALRYSPDVVVLQFGWNDVRTNYERLPLLEGGEYRGDEQAPVSGSLSPKAFLQRHSAMYLALAERYSLFQLRTRGTTDLLETIAATPPDSWSATREVLGAMARLCRERGALLIVAYLPMEVEVYASDDRKGRAIASRLRQICDEHEIAYLDILEPLRSSATKELYLDDVHLTPDGNLVAAEVIAERIARAGAGAAVAAR